MVTSKEIFKLVNSVRQNIKWQNSRFDDKLAQYFEKKYNFKFVNRKILLKQIDIITMEFDINLLWNKEYMNIKKHESICGNSTEINNYINRLKGGYYDDAIKEII